MDCAAAFPLPNSTSELFNVVIIPAHPVGVEEVRGSSLVFRPEAQILPCLAILAGVCSSRSGGNDSTGRHEDRRRHRNAPALHRRLAGAIRTTASQLLAVDAQFESVASLPFAEFRFAVGGHVLFRAAPMHASI